MDTGRRLPVQPALSTPRRRSKVRSCLCSRPYSQSKELVVDDQAQELAVGDVDDRLSGFRISVAGLGVRERPGLVEAGEVGAGEPRGLALVEVSPQPEMAVGEREHRLGLGEQIRRSEVSRSDQGSAWYGSA